jgi:hypothetical protein
VISVFRIAKDDKYPLDEVRTSKYLGVAPQTAT